MPSVAQSARSGQLAAVVHVMETMVSPEEDGDTLSNAERQAVAEADEWLKQNQRFRMRSSGGVRLTMAEWEKMGQEPLPKKRPPQCLSASSGPERQGDLRGIEQPIACGYSGRWRAMPDGAGNASSFEIWSHPDPAPRQAHRIFFRQGGY